jgi:hypothetical protein
MVVWDYFLAFGHWIWRKVADGSRARHLGPDCRRFAGDPARLARGFGRLGIGGEARHSAASAGGRGRSADRADVAAVPGWEIVAEDGADGGGASSRCNSASEWGPAATVRLVGENRRLSGGGVSVAVGSGAAIAGYGGIARRSASGRSDIAAVVPCAGVGMAGAAAQAREDQDHQTTQTQAQTGAVSDTAAARGDFCGATGGFWKNHLKGGEEMRR